MTAHTSSKRKRKLLCSQSQVCKTDAYLNRRNYIDSHCEELVKLQEGIETTAHIKQTQLVVLEV